MAQEDGKEISILNRVDSFMRATANGATLGLADVIAGVMNKVTPQSVAKLLNTTSCQSALLLCVDDELQRTKIASREAPLETAVGFAVGNVALFKLPNVVFTEAERQLTIGQLGRERFIELTEHAVSVMALNSVMYGYVKPKISNTIVFNPHTPEEQITAPSFENLSKELVGLRKR